MQRRQSSQRTIAVLNKTFVPQTKDKSHSSQACDGSNVFNHCLSPHGWNDVQHITALACIYCNSHSWFTHTNSIELSKLVDTKKAEQTNAHQASLNMYFINVNLCVKNIYWRHLQMLLFKATYVCLYQYVCYLVSKLYQLSYRNKKIICFKGFIRQEAFPTVLIFHWTALGTLLSADCNL